MFKKIKNINFLKKEKNKKIDFEDSIIIFLAIIMLNLCVSLFVNLISGGLIMFFREIPDILFYALLQILAFFLLFIILNAQNIFFNSFVYKNFLEKNFIFKIGFFYTFVHFIFLATKNFYLVKNYHTTVIILIPILFFAWFNDKKYTIKYFLFFIVIGYIFLLFAKFLEFYTIDYFSKKDYFFKIAIFIIFHLFYSFILQIIYISFRKISYKKYL